VPAKAFLTRQNDFFMKKIFVLLAIALVSCSSPPEDNTIFPTLGRLGNEYFVDYNFNNVDIRYYYLNEDLLRWRLESFWPYNTHICEAIKLADQKNLRMYLVDIQFFNNYMQCHKGNCDNIDRITNLNHPNKNT